MEMAKVGEFWAYRESDWYGASVRVEILDIVPKGKTAVHYTIRLENGIEKTVLSARVKCLWTDVAEMDRHLEALQRFDAEALGKH